VKLDPEERVIATALDQAELDDANERGAEAWIEFLQEGHAKVTITISRELVAKARAPHVWAAPQPEAVETVLLEAA
jgi:hypothetical protein